MCHTWWYLISAVLSSFYTFCLQERAEDEITLYRMGLYIASKNAKGESSDYFGMFAWASQEVNVLLNADWILVLKYRAGRPDSNGPSTTFRHPLHCTGFLQKKIKKEQQSIVTHWTSVEIMVIFISNYYELTTQGLLEKFSLLSFYSNVSQQLGTHPAPIAGSVFSVWGATCYPEIIPFWKRKEDLLKRKYLFVCLFFCVARFYTLRKRRKVDLISHVPNL